MMTSVGKYHPWILLNFQNRVLERLLFIDGKEAYKFKINGTNSWGQGMIDFVVLKMSAQIAKIKETCESFTVTGTIYNWESSLLGNEKELIVYPESLTLNCTEAKAPVPADAFDHVSEMVDQ